MSWSMQEETGSIPWKRMGNCGFTRTSKFKQCLTYGKVRTTIMRQVTHFKKDLRWERIPCSQMASCKLVLVWTWWNQQSKKWSKHTSCLFLFLFHGATPGTTNIFAWQSIHLYALSDIVFCWSQPPMHGVQLVLAAAHLCQVQTIRYF